MYRNCQQNSKELDLVFDYFGFYFRLTNFTPMNLHSSIQDVVV